MIRVNLMQLLQWRTWLRMEERAGKTCAHSSGRSVKAHACRTIGLSIRSQRPVVLEHLDAIIQACKNAGASLTDTVELSVNA